MVAVPEKPHADLCCSLNVLLIFLMQGFAAHNDGSSKGFLQLVPGDPNRRGGVETDTVEEERNIFSHSLADLVSCQSDQLTNTTNSFASSPPCSKVAAAHADDARVPSNPASATSEYLLLIFIQRGWISRDHVRPRS